jgi:flagellar hook-associated protein 3 FlgL
MRADPSYINSLTQSLNSAAITANNLSSQLSSGLRVGSLSDDPSAAAQSVRMGSQIATIDTFIQTASNETSMLQVTDSTLGEVVTQLTSAVTLAVQAANGTLNTANLQAIMQQATGIRDQVLALANASYQGRYLFAGSKGTTAPYSLDTSTAPATATYNGDTNVQFIQTPGGQTIQMNLPGPSLFGSGSAGALGMLNKFIDDLSSGASSTTLAADSTALNDALSTVSSQRSILNGSLSTLKSTSTYAQTQEAQMKAQQGSLVASDPAAIATQLKSNQTQYEALLNVISSLNKVNLFDYLK